jgi:hypothetical protein
LKKSGAVQADLATKAKKSEKSGETDSFFKPEIHPINLLVSVLTGKPGPLSSENSPI